MSVPISPISLDRESTELKILLYNSSARGSGQFVRSLKLARLVVDNFQNATVLVLVGNGFFPRPIPARTDIVRLPEIGKSISGEFVPRLGCVLDAFKVRKAIIDATVRSYAPNIFMVDTRPSGLNGELLDILRRMKVRSECKLVLILRDIVDEASRVRKDWEQQGVYQLLQKLYDNILILGNPQVYNSIDGYGLEPCGSKVLQVGYIGRCQPLSSGAHSRQMVPGRILVTVGGGFDGAPIVQGVQRHIRESAAGGKSTSTYRIVLGRNSPLDPACVLTGFGPAQDRVEIVPHSDSLEDFIDESELAITMCGYNTLLELIEAQKKIIAVPRSNPGREQLLRARVLSEHYDPMWVLPTELVSTPRLGILIDRALEAPRSESPFQMMGARNVVRYLEGLAPKTTGRQ